MSCAGNSEDELVILNACKDCLSFAHDSHPEPGFNTACATVVTEIIEAAGVTIIFDEASQAI